MEKEYKTWWNSISGKINVEHIMEWYMHETARHFYELGKARKFEEQPSTPPDFDTEVYNWLREHGSDETRQLIEMTARHFWEVAQNGGAMLHIADKSYKMGRRDERMELMKKSVEALVCAGMEDNKELVTYIGDYETFLKTNKIGDKVKILILKAEDEK